jgi:hypothetical protein
MTTVSFKALCFKQQSAKLEVQNVLLVTPANKYLSSISSMGFGKTYHWFKVTFLSLTTITHFIHVENVTCDQQTAYKCARNKAQHPAISGTCGRQHACQVRWIMHKFYILHK